MHISTDFLFQHRSAPLVVGLCVVCSFVQHRGKMKCSCFRIGFSVSFQSKERGALLILVIRCLRTVPALLHCNNFVTAPLTGL